MAAPIQRYSDPRLYGTTLVKPFNASYQWIRTVANPLHTKCSIITECAVRTLKVITGILALAITALPALTGRLIQIIHYHAISKENRAAPSEVVVGGMKLPHLTPCSLPADKKYHGTNEAAAIGILRWGFNPAKAGSGAKIAQAVYVSASNTVSTSYGEDQLIVSIDLREEEIAYLSDDDLEEFTKNKDFSDKKVMAAVRELFYQNGYRAIKYDLDHYGLEEGWAIYDPSCISIKEIRPSPFAAPIMVPNS